MVALVPQYQLEKPAPDALPTVVYSFAVMALYLLPRPVTLVLPVMDVRVPQYQLARPALVALPPVKLSTAVMVL
jgi:hypothetical protein